MLYFCSDQLLDAFENFLKHLTHLQPSMLGVAKLLIRNKQGSSLPQMCLKPSLTPECKTLGAIIVHTTVVLSANSKQPLLFPLVNMLFNPTALVVSYLLNKIEMKFKYIAVVEHLPAYYG